MNRGCTPVASGAGTQLSASRRCCAGSQRRWHGPGDGDNVVATAPRRCCPPHRRRDGMKNLISRVQRELPDTDKDRYDVAYERGAAQKRSGMLFGGLAAGAVAGLVGMYLLDPIRGA